MYVAYRTSLSEGTEVFHNNLRERWLRGDAEVVGAMETWAGYAAEGRACLLQRNYTRLNQLVDANFDLRAKIYQIDPGNLEMVYMARAAGATANFAGSGGAIVGTYEDEAMFGKLTAAGKAIGVAVIKPKIVVSGGAGALRRASPEASGVVTLSWKSPMPEGSYLYCDVSLPVPLDQPFTYSLPDTLRHRVRVGSRLIVPFGTRKLTGVILRCHDDPPAVAARDALRLIDSEPVLSAELMALGRWIAGYYCSPLGDVLRGMLPLSSEIRRGKIWTLTDSGRDAARQLLLDSSPDDPVLQILRMLEKRPLSASYLAKSMPLADKAIRALERKRFIVAEEVQVERDPLRAPSDRLRVELAAAAKGPEPKLNKPERELRAFLELHPGSHNLKELEDMVKHASAAARSLARKGDGFAQARDRRHEGRHPRAPRFEPRAAGRVPADS